jgi:hypothetical protein
MEKAQDCPGAPRFRPELSSLCAGGPVYWLEVLRRPVSAPRIQVLARHVTQHSVALFCRGIPVEVLPVGADQARERVARRQAHANAVPLRGRRVEIEVVRMTNIHDVRMIPPNRGARRSRAMLPLLRAVALGPAEHRARDPAVRRLDEGAPAARRDRRGSEQPALSRGDVVRQIVLLVL